MEEPNPKPTQPIIDPTTGPVEPLPRARWHYDTWGVGSFVPLLILIPFVAIVLVFSAHSLDTNRLGSVETPSGVYVEQKLEADSSRAAEDRTRDRMKERDHEALAEDRLGDMATVDLTQAPVTEAALKSSMNQLKNRLEILEPRAQESGYAADFGRLLDSYQSLAGRTADASDLADTQQREQLGRELSELRAQVNQFESDLNDIAVAR